MKKNIFFLTALLLACTSVAFTQPDEQEEIRRMEMRWMTALSKRDSVVMDRCMGKDFELAKIGAEGSTNIKRDQWIKNALEMDWSKFAFTSMQIKIDSNVATVNSMLSFKLKPYPFRLSSGIVDVWRKTDRGWIVEKRYLAQDNLSRWLTLLTGAGIGIGLFILFRWIRSFFGTKTARRKD